MWLVGVWILFVIEWMWLGFCLYLVGFDLHVFCGWLDFAWDLIVVGCILFVVCL